MGIAGQPMQVRNHDGEGVDTKAGPFLRSDLPIAGFAVIEASALDEAVRLIGPERVRVWQLYLHAAHHGFVSGFETVYQVRCSRP